jgi:hypothetical protein
LDKEEAELILAANLEGLFGRENGQHSSDQENTRRLSVEGTK